MSRLWQDAASILETASAPSSAQSEPADFAILIDRQNGLRMLMNTAGWQIDALRSEYGAAAAYTVKRTTQALTVEGQDNQSRCLLSKSLGGQLPFSGMHGLPHHLIRPQQHLIA